MKETIQSIEDVLTMLDELLKEESKFNWNSFYSDREKPVPFFANAPDENLVQYVQTNLLKPGKALDLGCGPGRNAIYLAKQGWEVDALDLSPQAIHWAKERATESSAKVNFILCDLFDFDLDEGAYDLIYDSGCFHYVPPHRRMNYLNIINKALKPVGAFGITCFKVGGKYGGADLSDWEVYRQKSLRGGLGYTKDRLIEVFHNFEMIELREMREMDPSSSSFGSSALLCGLFRNIGE
ncbi:class I SAM-dependent methyltransferase [Paenibacillus sp. Marseille-Q4541]|uniref:class I SAM-dependent methyltransferase n=1 Tax=Paenibacillus sp. Marseille-Q4541 TaxID=2831522 RepID=UPI001BA84585|nr:class I SAM-dependent methyltransferase [Paenibacillus sp. Marseille-Q4541]